MIPVCIFTYAGDALPLKQCVRAINLAGLIPVIIDDAANPLPGWSRGWIDVLGIDYRQSTFNRRGNLRGTDCAAGICEALAQAAEDHEADAAIKLDTDTIIVDPSWLMGGNVCFTSSNLHRRYAYGCSYSIRRSSALSVAHKLRIDHPEPIPHAFEDITIWQTLENIGHKFKVHDFNANSGPFCAAPVGASPHDCRRFGAITFGNEPINGWRDRPLETASEMRRFVDWLASNPAGN